MIMCRKLISKNNSPLDGKVIVYTHVYTRVKTPYFLIIDKIYNRALKGIRERKNLESSNLL